MLHFIHFFINKSTDKKVGKISNLDLRGCKAEKHGIVIVYVVQSCSLPWVTNGHNSYWNVGSVQRKPSAKLFLYGDLLIERSFVPFIIYFTVNDSAVPSHFHNLSLQTKWQRRLQPEFKQLMEMARFMRRHFAALYVDVALILWCTKTLDKVIFCLQFCHHWTFFIASHFFCSLR